MAASAADRAIDLARQIEGLPRRRARVFGTGTINDVQWDMLVRLFIAEGDGEQTAFAGLTIGSGTTVEDARRWLADLVDRRLIAMSVVERGGVEFASLTALARQRVTRTLIGDGDDGEQAE